MNVPGRFLEKFIRGTKISAGIGLNIKANDLVSLEFLYNLFHFSAKNDKPSIIQLRISLDD
jgi:hypothetical protein